MHTIAAISTPLSSSGLGVVRICGEDSVSIAEKVFRPFKKERSLDKLDGYSCAYGRVFDAEGDIDDAVATVFLSPKSYTGENTVELSCHGSPQLLKRVLRSVYEAGAKPAEPGEFTKRAFLNGKITLTQAEAVMDIISAKSVTAGKAALSMRDGALYKRITQITNQLTDLQSHIAAWADYPEEDVPQLSDEILKQTLNECSNELKQLIDSYDMGRIIREGAVTVICGKPNVGKSTLMNLISGRNRSIVTEIAGTTRDVVEENVFVGDIPIRLLDTAGIHSTEDTVEKIGVDMATSEIEKCDLVLAVFDNSIPLSDDDLDLISKLKNKPAIAVINKSDLEKKIDMNVIHEGFEKSVIISAKNGSGIEEFRKCFEEVLKTSDFDPSVSVMANERQLDCAKRGQKAVLEAYETIEMGMTLDAVGICIDTALDCLFELTGEKASDAVINKVFERFCVGK